MAVPHPDELVIDDRDRGLFGVHRSTMTSPEIMELERERIFDRCWLYVGHESEIAEPRDFRRRSVVGRPIIFVHGADGEIRALLERR
jgi:p-cumate 2,3-dioxygenase alpha subunit